MYPAYIGGYWTRVGIAATVQLAAVHSKDARWSRPGAHSRTAGKHLAIQCQLWCAFLLWHIMICENDDNTQDGRQIYVFWHYVTLFDTIIITFHDMP